MFFQFLLVDNKTRSLGYLRRRIFVEGSTDYPLNLAQTSKMQRTDEDIHYLNLQCEHFATIIRNYFNVGLKITIYSESPNYYDLVWSTAGGDMQHKYPIQKLEKITFVTSGNLPSSNACT